GWNQICSIYRQNHRLPGKVKRMGPILGHTMHYRR
ncbi:unnamed protein product, partial [Brassica oleracea var. botrytis]